MTTPFLLATWLGISQVPPEPRILPLSEVRAGMSGVGRTVFTGGRIEEFGVEVLGVIAGSNPRRNTILARLSGGPLAESGVIAGMSGSPVYLDGRLAGAVAGAYLFAKAPIAGITPIEEMMAIPQREEPSALPALKPRGGAAPARLLERLRRIERGEAPSALAADGAWPEIAPADGAPRPAVVLAGLAAPGLPRAVDWFRGRGFTPLESAAVGRAPAGGSSSLSSSLEPGGLVAVEFIRGDANVAGFGTVTYRDGDRLLAFGHPMFGLGSVRFPVASAEVVTVLPSVMSSFKIANLGERIGALVEDRAAGVMARLGAEAETIPLRLGVKRGAAPIQDYAFELAVHRLLTPALVDLAVSSALASGEKPLGEASLDLAGRIEIEGHPAILLDHFFSGDQAVTAASDLVAALVALVLDNDMEPVRVSGITLVAGYREESRVATLERVWVDRARAAPGDWLELKATLRRVQGGEQEVRARLRVPPGTLPGTLELAVGDSTSLARFEARAARSVPRSLDQLIGLVNGLRKASELHLLLSRQDAGMALKGARLSSLPPSAYALLAQGDGAELQLPLKRAVLAETAVETSLALTGLRTLRIVVEANRP